MKRFFAIASAALCASLAAAPLASFPGAITDRTPGWKFAPSQPNRKGMTYNKFEGYYPDKGGKLFSPRIKLDKESGKASYYRIVFEAEAPERSYQGINFYDAEGRLLPDDYDVVYAGGRHVYDRVFYAMDKVDSVEIFFQSNRGCRVWDVRLEKTCAETAAQYCDRVYGELPPLRFEASADAMALLPKTADALRSGKPWRIVLLGDSIMQDLFHSQFHALIQRDFPKANVSWIISMRGSTGCWHYCQDGPFKEYVADEHPDLLIIGGISNYNAKFHPDGHEAMEIVARKAKTELGCEVLLLTGALASDTRGYDPEAPDADLPVRKWDFRKDSWAMRTTDPEGLQATGKRLGVPVWNLLFPCYEWLYSTGKPHEFYSRDKVHSGELGKQIIGRTATGYFKAAQTGNIGK